MKYLIVHNARNAPIAVSSMRYADDIGELINIIHTEKQNNSWWKLRVYQVYKDQQPILINRRKLEKLLDPKEIIRIRDEEDLSKVL